MPRVEAIAAAAERMEQMRAEALPLFQSRLQDRIAELLEGAGLEPQRLAQEAAVLADRSDVGEELARLRIHAGQMIEILRAGGEIGKRLDFLAQEMHRETNTVLSKVIENARESIKEGESIAGPLKRSGQFPPIVYHMIAIGEKSGSLEEMLTNVADAYDSQVETRISALTSLLEPIMIVMMGGVVAFIVFSILMPILQMNTLVQ